MITGAHSIIYSTDAEKDRAFFRDVLKLDNVDAGGGWLIFKLPPSEVAFHPADANGRQEFYFTCNDIQQFTEEMQKHDIECSAVQNEGWGLLVQVSLPGGGQLGVYEPRHP